MKTTIFSILAILMIVTLVSTIPGTWNEAVGDDDRRDGMRFASRHVDPAKNPQYVEECGSCHLAYPPDLLPADSWGKIMAGLKDHFGDNAELDAQTMNQIENYLRTNSANMPGNQRSYKFVRSANGQAPRRITDLPYFKHKHREVPQHIIKSKQVVSLSQCDSCHQDAARGVFDEDRIYIKGIGHWDD